VRVAIIGLARAGGSRGLAAIAREVTGRIALVEGAAGHPPRPSQAGCAGGVFGTPVKMLGVVDGLRDRPALGRMLGWGCGAAPAAP
jgi:hypothetical protein